jgi:hypothetical protein
MNSLIYKVFTKHKVAHKADLHVDTFSMEIQNIILYNVKFKYYPYVYAYTHAIWSCRHNLQGDILHQLISINFSDEILFTLYNIIF